MDEPCSALDPISTLAIEDLIGELKERFTIVIVTHNMQQAARVSDRTAFFNLVGRRPARQAHRDRRHRADLLQPVRPGHRGLHLRPLRLTPGPSPAGEERPSCGAAWRCHREDERARPRLPGGGPVLRPRPAPERRARTGASARRRPTVSRRSSSCRPPATSGRRRHGDEPAEDDVLGDAPAHRVDALGRARRP